MGQGLLKEPRENGYLVQRHSCKRGRSLLTLTLHRSKELGMWRLRQHRERGRVRRWLGCGLGIYGLFQGVQDVFKFRIHLRQAQTTAQLGHL